MLPSTLVMQESDYLVLLRRNSTAETFSRVRSDPIIPDIYHDLKMVSHIPLAIFVILVPFAEGNIPFPEAALTSYLDR